MLVSLCLSVCVYGCIELVHVFVLVSNLMQQQFNIHVKNVNKMMWRNVNEFVYFTAVFLLSFLSSYQRELEIRGRASLPVEGVLRGEEWSV